MKYIIANGNQYVVQDAKNKTFGFTNVLESATRFKQNNALQFYMNNLGSDPKYVIRKVGCYKSNKNYVITTASRFVAMDTKQIYTDKIQQAKTFRSIADVEAYLLTNKKIFPETFVLDENENTVVMPERRKFTTEQLQTLGIQPKTPAVSKCNKVKRKHIAKSVRDYVYANNHGICAICGKPVDKNSFTIDHIVPLSRGGKDELSNYQIACDRCNKLKSNSKDEEFLKSITDILTNHIELNVNNEITDKIIRTIFRAKLNNMKGAAYLQMK